MGLDFLLPNINCIIVCVCVLNSSRKLSHHSYFKQSTQTSQDQQKPVLLLAKCLCIRKKTKGSKAETRHTLAHNMRRVVLMYCLRPACVIKKIPFQLLTGICFHVAPSVGDKHELRPNKWVPCRQIKIYYILLASCSAFVSSHGKKGRYYLWAKGGKYMFYTHWLVCVCVSSIRTICLWLCLGRNQLCDFSCIFEVKLTRQIMSVF